MVIKHNLVSATINLSVIKDMNDSMLRLVFMIFFPVSLSFVDIGYAKNICVNKKRGGGGSIMSCSGLFMTLKSKTVSKAIHYRKIYYLHGHKQ